MFFCQNSSSNKLFSKDRFPKTRLNFSSSGCRNLNRSTLRPGSINFISCRSESSNYKLGCFREYLIIDGGGCATHCGGLESEGDGVVHHGQGPEGGQHVLFAGCEEQCRGVGGNARVMCVVGWL